MLWGSQSLAFSTVNSYLSEATESITHGFADKMIVEMVSTRELLYLYKVLRTLRKCIFLISNKLEMGVGDRNPQVKTSDKLVSYSSK